MRVRIKVYLETIIIIQQRKQIVLKMKKSTKKVKESTAASRQTEDGAIKEITPKKRKKGRYILIYLAIIGFVFYAVITIINQNVQIAEKKAELTDLQQQISVVEIQSQYLKKVQNYKGDDLKKYIEKIAKDELGYVGNRNAESTRLQQHKHCNEVCNLLIACGCYRKCNRYFNRHFHLAVCNL